VTLDRLRRRVARGLERALVVALGAVLGVLARRPSPGAPIRRILVLRVDPRVGNVLLTTPLLDVLAEARPGAEVYALVAASKRALVPPPARALTFDKRAFVRAPLRFLRDLWGLRALRADVAIDASHAHELSTTSSLLLAWTGAPVRIAHARPGAAWVATVRVPLPHGDETVAKCSLAWPLLDGARPTRAMRAELGRSGAGAALAAAALSGAGRWVGLMPGARKPDHRLDPAVFVAAARAARAAGCTPIVLWGPGEEALAAPVVAAGAVLAPPTDLDALAACLRRCAAVVANDTGPMHLAVAVGTPTIGLFVAGDHARWGHAEPPHVVLDLAALDTEARAARVTEALARVLGRVG
jgi:heptosyltransferase-3